MLGLHIHTHTRTCTQRGTETLLESSVYHTHFLARGSCICVTVQLIMIEPIDAD